MAHVSAWPRRIAPRAHFLGIIGEAKRDAADFESQALVLFRQFLALKIAAPVIFADGIHWPLSFRAGAIFLAVLMAGWQRFYLPGLCTILGLSFVECARSWPFTINHSGLEFGILLLMCLMPADGSARVRLSCADMIRVLMLSVWFFSGIHKLFDGYYLNGEFFALEAWADQTTLGHALKQIVDIFGGHWGILLVLSWLTILGEILLPLAFLKPKLRPYTLLGLFFFQAVIAHFSGEIDFAFTAFGVLFLFIPRLALFTYPGLAAMFLVVQPWL